MNKKQLTIALLTGFAILSIFINKAQQKKQDPTDKKAVIAPTDLKKFATILDVNVICSKDENIKISDYKPKNFQKKFAVQYENEQKEICHILPGFIEKVDAQMASGSLLLHYLDEKKIAPQEEKENSTCYKRIIII